MAARGPTISVVMPVYNGADYLKSAVESVLRQTWREFEIVLVDDGSRDDGRTDAICRAYAAAHPQTVVHISQENAGVGAALNAGVAAMRGDVFCWLSHDDLYEPHKLERQVDFHRRLEKPNAMLISDYDLIDSDGVQTGRVTLDHGAALRAPRLPLYKGWVNGCTIFIPRDILPAGAPFDPQYRHVQDYRLWMRLLDAGELFHQPEVLVRYRVHGAQDSRKPEAVTEGDALWIDMIDGLSPAARTQIAGSNRRFLQGESERLADAGYAAAAAHAARLHDDAGTGTLATIIVLATGDEAAVRRSLDSLPPAAAALESVVADASDMAALNRALLDSAGDYVTFVHAGRDVDPQDVARRLSALQEAGARWSHGPEADGAIDPATVMIHRLAISAGFRFTGGAGPTDAAAWDELRSRYPALRPEPEGAPSRSLLPGEDLCRRLEALRLEVDERLRFLKEPRFHAPRPAVFDLRAPSVHYQHPADPADGAAASFTTGDQPWAYVVAAPIDIPADATLLQVYAQTGADDAYVRLVDRAYQELGERRRIGPHARHRVWFDLEGLPEAVLLIVQVGAEPRNQRIDLIEASLLTPDTPSSAPGD